MSPEKDGRVGFDLEVGSPSFSFPRKGRIVNPDKHCDTVDGLDRQRRVAWAKYFEERQKRMKAQARNAVDQQQITFLIEVLRELVDSVLTDKNIVSFRKAQRIDEFLKKIEEKEAG